MDRDVERDGAGRLGDALPFLRSGTLARLSGVSTDTLRHYERLRLLPAPRRSTNGYREYPPRALDRVRLVRRALALGFSLRELAGVLCVRDRGGSPCHAVRALAVARLAAMERERAELSERCNALRRTLRAWDDRLARTPRGRQARLLDHVAVTRPETMPHRRARTGLISRTRSAS